MEILVRDAKIITPVSSETHHKINFHSKENNEAFKCIKLTEVFSNKFVCLLAFFCAFCRILALMDPSLYNTRVTILFYSYLETRKKGI
jgi:hypothetical protein